MKWIRKAPLFFMVVSTGILFTVLAIAGKNSIYSSQEYEPLKEPVLTVMFTGVNDGIYPWQLLDRSVKETSMETAVTGEEAQGPESEQAEKTNAEEDKDAESKEVAKAVMPTTAKEGTIKETQMPAAAAMPTALPTPEPTPYSIQNERLEPLRESTEKEYLNHISADIYGDAGVVRAASYEFEQVDESYFDDALFIGDSRTVGLHDYTDLKEHATFLCETSLTIYKVMEEDFKDLGTVEEVLEKGDYKKIYLMIGINELGRGTTEDFMAKYTEVVDKLHELEPEALIFIQGNMRVSEEKSSDDKIFNNDNINARNNAVATLADNIQVFYIDVNEVVCDEEGNLNAEYTFDQIHLLGVYNDLWKQFLMEHGASYEKSMANAGKTE